jgi:hypothetical protein
MPLLSMLSVLTALTSLALSGCDRPISSPFTDSFDRSELGSDYNNTGAPWHLEDGKLVGAQVHNHPLWLKRRLPDDVKIDVDVASRSPDGDIKVEVAGDGDSRESDDAVARDLKYTASGYVFIFGGWRNSRSVLVRQNEHAWERDRSTPIRFAPRVEPNRTYHWTIVKRGGHIEWSIDNQPFLTYDDPMPLHGKGQDHFGFTGWETEVVFDNLRIEPL